MKRQTFELIASRLRSSVWILSLSLTIAVSAMVYSPPQGSADVERATALALASGVLSLFVFLAAGRWTETAKLQRLALTYQLAMGLVISLTEILFTYDPQATVRGVSWVCLWIVLFPIVVPMGRTSAWIGALGTACSGVLALVLARLDGLPSASLQTNVYLLLPNFLAAAIALMLHRIVLGLRARVQSAEALGAYQLEARIGRGGMGEVWRASHRLLARPAAVKVIRPGARDSIAPTRLETSREASDSFAREARAMAQLSSPHTVHIYDYGTTQGGEAYYAMELLDGVDLQTLVERDGPLEARRVVHFLQQASHSLAEAHRAGFVHGDIKPANLFVCRFADDADFLKVLDFGLVSTRGEGGGATPAYAAPDDVVDAPADIYALGGVGYYCLTGRPPFQARSLPALIEAHRSEAPVPPRNRVDDVPDELEALILRCLSKDSRQRPQNGSDMLERLRELRDASAAENAG